MTVQNPPIFVQEGSHPAEDTRRALEALAAGTSGYSSASALAVTERASLTNMSVDVAGGGVWVPGTEGTFQGSYFCDNRGTTNLTIAAADATNPRIDLVVAQVEDSEYSGSVDQWSLSVVTGTPAASPVAPSAPANSVSLAQVAVAALASQIVDANITDLRDLDVTAHGSVNIPGDLTVTTDASVGGDLTVTTDASVGGDLTVTGNLTAANQGLVLVKTQTIGSGVSSVTVTDAFDSRFDNYLILINAVTGSVASGFLQMTLSGASTAYYQSFNHRTPGAAQGSSDVVNGAFFRLCLMSNGQQNNARFDVLSPFLNLVTQIHGQSHSRNSYSDFGGGRDTASHTGFTIYPSTGTITGGTIRVYGYGNG